MTAKIYDEIELTYLDPVPNIPEDKRFAIIHHSFVEEGYGVAFANHKVVSFYDRKTRAYTTLDDRGYFGPSISFKLDYYGIFEKGCDDMTAECQPFEEWELMDANKCLERIIETARDLQISHSNKNGLGERYLQSFKKIAGDAAAFMRDVFEFENEFVFVTFDSDHSPLSELPNEYANRDDWMRHSLFMEQGYNEDGDDWEAYFENEYPRFQMNVSMKCDDPYFVGGITHPDIGEAIRKFRMLYPDALIIHAARWDSPDAVFVFDADSDEKEKTFIDLIDDLG